MQEKRFNKCMQGVQLPQSVVGLEKGERLKTKLDVDFEEICSMTVPSLNTSGSGVCIVWRRRRVVPLIPGLLNVMIVRRKFWNRYRTVLLVVVPYRECSGKVVP